MTAIDDAVDYSEWLHGDSEDFELDDLDLDLDEAEDYFQAGLLEFDDLDGWEEDTPYPMVRDALDEEYYEVSDEEVEAIVLEATGGALTAEELESFGSVISNIGRALGNLLPSIGSGAAAGATIGSVFPGAGTAIGAGIGGLAGGLLGALGSNKGSRSAPRHRPQPPQRGPAAPRRTGVSRPRSTAPSPTSAQAASSLLAILTNPQVIHAVTSMLLGARGRQSVTVAGEEVPVGAFAELIAEAAKEAGFAHHTETITESSEDDSWLTGRDGTHLVDVSSAAERSGCLLAELIRDRAEGGWELGQYDDQAIYTEPVYEITEVES